MDNEKIEFLDEMDEIEVLDDLKEIPEEENKEEKPKVKFSVLDSYGEDLTSKTYVTNPAIARDEEIKKLMIGGKFYPVSLNNEELNLNNVRCKNSTKEKQNIFII